MTSISFYLDNRKRVFVIKFRVRKLKKFWPLAPNFLQKCLLTLAWNRAGAPGPMPYNRRRKLWVVHSEERVNSRRWLTEISAKSDLQIAVVLNAIAQVSVRRWRCWRMTTTKICPVNHTIYVRTVWSAAVLWLALIGACVRLKYVR